MTGASRTATVRTEVDHPERAAACVRADNTPEMATRVDGDAVVTTIERDSTGGLRTTLDDYVVNLTVAVEVAQLADQHTQTNHE